MRHYEVLVVLSHTKFNHIKDNYLKFFHLYTHELSNEEYLSNNTHQF